MAGDQAMCVGFRWRSQSQDFSNSNNSCVREEKLDHMKPTNQKEEKVLVNKKRSREIVSRSETNKTNVEEVKGEKHHKSKHEAHILIERERRKKMRNMFATLHDLLPHLPSKADQSTIVDEAVSHIKNLQQTLEKLEKQKQERLQSISPLRHESSMTNLQWPAYDSNETFIVDPHGSINNNLPAAKATSNAPQLAFQTWSTPNVVLNICGDEAQFCIYATKKPGLLTTIAFVLQKHNIDVVSANILCKGNGNAYMIQAHVKRASHHFQDMNSTGETYVKAAGEIAKWVA